MEDRKTHYNKKGLYNSYDRNHKERDALDYYATPTKEVFNILQTLHLPLEGAYVLEPCIGGGHMAKGILDWLEVTGEYAYLIGTDIKDRGYNTEDLFYGAYGLDFFDDNYIYKLPEICQNIDYIIMNPPYGVIEPFVMKALGIANKGVLMLGRLQFLEGKSRYENILKSNPPTDVYIYVDRIKCYKNGEDDGSSSAQSYAWFYWDLQHACNCVTRMNKIILADDLEGYMPDEKTSENTTAPMIHWIRRAE